VCAPVPARVNGLLLNAASEGLGGDRETAPEARAWCRSRFDPVDRTPGSAQLKIDYLRQWAVNGKAPTEAEALPALVPTP